MDNLDAYEFGGLWGKIKKGAKKSGGALRGVAKKSGGVVRGAASGSVRVVTGGRRKKKKGNFFKRTLKAAGRAAAAPVTMQIKAVKKVPKVIKKTGRKIEKVPIIGRPMSANYDFYAEPIRFASSVVKNPKKVHRAAYNSAKRHIKMAQKAAPAMQIAAQALPGVGQGVSGAIAMGHALSKGASITEAGVAGLKGSIPGAPIYQAAFNIVADVKAGKKPSKIQLSTMNKYGVDGAKFSANVDAALDGDLSAVAAIDADLKKLNPKDRKAVETGIALGAGKAYQDIHKKGAGSIGAMSLLLRKGKAIVKESPILSQLNMRKIGLTNDRKEKGFYVGLATMAHKQNPTSLKAVLNRVKKSFGKTAVVGFYLAVAFHIGLSSREPLPEGSAYQQFGYYVAEGLRSDESIRRKKSILAILAKIDESRTGVAAIIQENEDEMGWWERFMNWLSTPF